jgi:hypothetical protein
MRTDRRTYGLKDGLIYMTKLIVAFRNFAIGNKNVYTEETVKCDTHALKGGQFHKLHVENMIIPPP